MSAAPRVEERPFYFGPVGFLKVFRGGGGPTVHGTIRLECCSVRIRKRYVNTYGR